MSTEFDQSLRVRGGNGFASAMFRVNAHSRQYSKRLGDALIAKMGVSESIRIMDNEEFFILTINDQPMILKDYGFVELKRQEALFAFEEWLEKTIVGLLK
jgi:N-acetylmuramoyl-L-alanine amidase